MLTTIAAITFYKIVTKHMQIIFLLLYCIAVLYIKIYQLFGKLDESGKVQLEIELLKYPTFKVQEKNNLRKNVQLHFCLNQVQIFKEQYLNNRRVYSTLQIFESQQVRCTLLMIVSHTVEWIDKFTGKIGRNIIESFIHYPQK